MITHTQRILVGARGWLHPAWQTQFYPDDLPEDWQLGYYSNEFPVVLMPATYWQGSADAMPGWWEDSSDNLCIVCEVPPEMLQLANDEAVKAINEFIAGLALFGEQCVGLLLSVADARVDLDAVLAQLDRRYPLCLEAGLDSELKTIQKVCEQHRFGLCWHGQGPTDGLVYGQLAMTRIDSHGMTLRQLRDVVETMLKATTLEQTSVLIIDGNPPDLEAIRHTGVILDLF